MSKKPEMVAHNDSLEIFRLETEPFGTNAYILACRDSSDSILIDAPGDAPVLLDKLKETNPRLIVITHRHMDHTMALEEITTALDVPLAAHEKDAGELPVKPSKLLADGDIIKCGKVTIRVLHTPGHTAGGICLLAQNYLLSGDTIFPGGPGKTGSPSDFKTIINTLREKIFTLPDDTIIFPGHGSPGIIKTEKELFEAYAEKGLRDDICGDVTWT